MFGSKKEIQKDFDVFVIYDSKGEFYDMPMYAINEHDLIREITNHFRNEQTKYKNKYYLNAEDFSMFRIGSYSKKLGQLMTHPPEHCANLHDLRAVADKEQMRQTYAPQQPPSLALDEMRNQA